MDYIIQCEAFLHDFGDERVEENQSKHAVVDSTVVRAAFRESCCAQSVHKKLDDVKLVSFKCGLD
eukprot:1438130-Rhodomonas_salina.1